MFPNNIAGRQYVGRAVRKSFPDEVTGLWRPFNGTVASFDPVDTMYDLLSATPGPYQNSCAAKLGYLSNAGGCLDQQALLPPMSRRHRFEDSDISLSTASVFRVRSIVAIVAVSMPQ